MKYLIILLVLTSGFVNAKEISDEELVAPLMKISHLAGYCQAIIDILNFADKSGEIEKGSIATTMWSWKAKTLNKTPDELIKYCNDANVIYKKGASLK